MSKNSKELKVKYYGKGDFPKRKKSEKPSDISVMGYRDDSPYRSLPYIDIHTPDGTIDMSATGIPLWANGRILPPYSGIHQFDTTQVKEIPLAQKGIEITEWLKKKEKALNKSLGNPMARAEQEAAESAYRRGVGTDTGLDNFRHPMAGRYAAQAIEKKFPGWMQNYTPVPKIAGFLGSTALGAGHELSEPNTSADYNLWDTIREGGEDFLNNMVGAAVGVNPFMNEQEKTEYLEYLSDNNLLPDGVGYVDPKKNQGKGNLYWTKAKGGSSGWLRKYQGNRGGSETGKRPAKYKVTASDIEASDINEQSQNYYNPDDLYYSDLEYDKDKQSIAERVNLCKTTGKGCLSTANYWYNKWVAPKIGNPSSWDELTHSGVNSTEENTYDSWDVHGLDNRSVFYNRNSFKDKYSGPKAENIWKQLDLPIGAIVGYGEHGVLHQKFGEVSMNARKGLPEAGHSGRIVAFDKDTGEPWVFDSVNGLNRISKNTYSPISVISADNRILGNTYSNLQKGKNAYTTAKTIPIEIQWDDFIDEDGKVVSWDEDEFKPFMQAFINNKPKWQGIIGLDDKQYNEYTKIAGALAISETEGGNDNTWRYGLPAYTLDKMGFTNSTGITQLNNDVVRKLYKKHQDKFHRYGLFMSAAGRKQSGRTGRLYNFSNPAPQDAAFITMLLLKDNKANAERLFKKGKTNNPNLTDADKQWYTWNQQGTLLKGEAQGDATMLKKFRDAYNKIRVTEGKQPKLAEKKKGGSLPLAQTGRNIRVYTDPNQFRIAEQAYRDSLTLHDFNRRDEEFVRTAPRIRPNVIDASSWQDYRINIPQNWIDAYNRLTFLNDEEPPNRSDRRRFNISYFSDSESTVPTYYSIYKKPVVEPVYQSRPKLEPVAVMPMKQLTIDRPEMQLVQPSPVPPAPAFRSFSAAGYPMVDVHTGKSGTVSEGYYEGSEKEKKYRGKKQKGGWLKKSQTGSETGFIGPEEEQKPGVARVMGTDQEGTPILRPTTGYYLPEVEISAERPDTYSNYMLDRYKDAGMLEAVTMLPIDYALSFPQAFATKLMSGKYQLPSEAMGVENPLGSFAIDILTDPTNYIGAGLLSKGKGFVTKGKGLLRTGLKDAAQESISPSTIRAVEEIGLPAIGPQQAWSMSEKPGLHLRSTMTGSPLEKQISKSGTIDIESLKSHINKPELGGQDKYVIGKVLDEKFPGQKKIDYNEFRQAVQDELVDLEATSVQNYEHTGYGVKSLGYPGPTEKSAQVLRQIDNDIDDIVSEIKTERISSNDAGIIENLERTLEQARAKRDKIQEIVSEETRLNLPIENEMVAFGNVQKLGKGSSKHIPEDIQGVGHTRTLVTQDEPEVMHLLEIQSDLFQDPVELQRLEKVYKKKHTSPERIQKLENSYDRNVDEWNKTIAKAEKSGAPDYEIAEIKRNRDTAVRRRDLFKAEMKNLEQKRFLGKSHQERLLQESVAYAAKKGKTKVRVPTPETAAKIQGYPSRSLKDDLDKYLEQLEYMKIDSEFVKLPPDEILPIEEYGYKMLSETPVTKKEYINLINKKVEDLKKTPYKELYVKKHKPEHQSILKKYSEQPKIIKKTFGKDSKVVRDAKGNTWYEFDTPESYIQGKQEIKAFQKGGSKLPMHQLPPGQVKKQSKDNSQSIDWDRAWDKIKNPGKYPAMETPTLNNVLKLLFTPALFKDLPIFQEAPGKQIIYTKEGGSKLPSHLPEAYQAGGHFTHSAYYPVADLLYISPEDKADEGIYAHEAFHRFQNNELDSLRLPDYYPGPLRRPQTPSSEELVGDYWNRRGVDAALMEEDYLSDPANASFRFVPYDMMYNYVYNPMMYETPWTAEGEAMEAENAFRQQQENPMPGPESYKKKGGWLKKYQNAGGINYTDYLSGAARDSSRPSGAPQGASHMSKADQRSASNAMRNRVTTSQAAKNIATGAYNKAKNMSARDWVDTGLAGVSMVGHAIPHPVAQGLAVGADYAQLALTGYDAAKAVSQGNYGKGALGASAIAEKAMGSSSNPYLKAASKVVKAVNTGNAAYKAATSSNPVLAAKNAMKVNKGVSSYVNKKGGSSTNWLKKYK